jgi:lysophospholipid acyltransferase (LPLAT)-like uncharacterized protein
MSREAFLAGLGAAILKTLFLTLRLRIEDRSGLLEGRLAGPVILCFWHNRILGITFAYNVIYPGGRRGVTVLTSPSKDGEILARLVGAFRMGAVRGSSSRRGFQAQRELVRLVREGRDIAITPDGPRGPKYALGPGVVQLAQSTGAPVLPLHATFSRGVRMKTWDGFIIPLPFSAVSVTIGAPVHFPETPTDEAFEEARRHLEELLNHGAD